MVPEDRKKEILELLEQHGYLTVEEIAKTLYVSLPTIRRDLKAMDAEGIIKRQHGGASHINADRKEFPFDLRNRTCMAEKKIIGRLATGLLKGSDHIFIDTGSSCYAMAEELDQDTELTVLTNCIPTLQILSQKNRITVECPCGRYDPLHRSICGEEAAHFIDSRYANFYFGSATGLSEENGVNTLTAMDVAVKRAMRKNAEKTVLLMDHSKMNKRYYYNAFDLKDVDIIISDRPLPGNLAKRCKEYGIKMITP